MKEISQVIIPVLHKYGVTKASLFGSYARGSNDEKSDVDILIEPPEGMGMKFIYLKRELESTLHKKIDLVSYNGLNRHLKKYILADQVQLL